MFGWLSRQREHVPRHSVRRFFQADISVRPPAGSVTVTVADPINVAFAAVSAGLEPLIVDTRVRVEIVNLPMPMSSEQDSRHVWLPIVGFGAGDEGIADRNRFVPPMGGFKKK